MTRPYVYITGAGPGDPELLTCKAYRLLTEVAEVVVHDRLIPEAILSLIPAGVKRVYAGKSCAHHHMTQDEIHACLLEEARKNKIIVRLKGGDPMIFGRGGEEASFLQSHGIAYEIVAGISAASGISAALGIPLTHRDLAHGVRYVTGHHQKGAPLLLDWQGLAEPHTTLVVYMGLANIGTITAKLIEHGLPEETPAVAVQDGTTPCQRVCFSTIRQLEETLRKQEFKPPTLVVIGRAARLMKQE